MLQFVNITMVIYCYALVLRAYKVEAEKPSEVKIFYELNNLVVLLLYARMIPLITRKYSNMKQRLTG